MERKRVSMEVLCGVYCIQNLVNNKRYVGSSKDIYERWLCHKNSLNKNDHHSKHLQNAWNKYGCDNFSFFILELCSEDERFECEQKWYDYYKSYDPAFGYNYAPIAKSPRYYYSLDDLKNGKSKMSLEQFESIVYYLCNTIIPIPKIAEIVGVSRRIVYQIYYKKNYSKIVADMNFLRRPTFKDPKLSEEQVLEIIDKLLNNVPTWELADTYGVKMTTISDIIHHRTWKYLTEDIEFPDIHNRRNHDLGKHVVQFDLDGNILNTFISARQAFAETGVSYKHISLCCNNKRRTAGGFRWKFEKDLLV